ncbi:MAG: DUF3999 domain-containing protein [Candidatus Thiodiazotropha sp. (ex Lucinoma aequizonata)]|nr:DUF3999 domain-containing protein [Candidatus Thiodiazotropha sp. (ex Lucinoma aequizonata)]MCU7889807.1 DUF3999 domain-containing protein [Candidatus Thiodiazotropha sp. (ex Lucinoma aequizonata)]MCU7894620.1 DUF3999 domain-containing protein [Candidatus Thiodiazotropha sp. (ex Lucinoma aequizonata)]MCU7898768.1 DUF3999 domain-containing protein [Candidatus Thiodiazotropha sp. (ex Lucinoma aequizonata)]MCU7902808.1 DUF3999 domain-containing protein [Candidatus Thiodiazotropha sp. (ex Lucino
MPYRIAIGNSKAVAADLPPVMLIPHLNGVIFEAGVASIGEVVTDPVFQAVLPEEDIPSDWRRWMLWGVLLAGVALLVLMTLQIVRKHDRD